MSTLGQKACCVRLCSRGETVGMNFNKVIAPIVLLSLAFVTGVVLGAYTNEPQIRQISSFADHKSRLKNRKSLRKKTTALISAHKTQKTALKTPRSTKAAPSNNQFLNKKRTGYTVLLSSFKMEENAKKYAKKVAKKGYDAFYFSKKIKGKTWHRVGVGSFSSKSTAESLKKQLLENRLGKGFLISKIPKSSST